MRVAIIFESQAPDWTPQDYWDRMQLETSPGYEGVADAEYQVARALLDRGHDVILVGAYRQPDEITEALREQPPDIVFNLAEGFRAQDQFDFVLPAALEMAGIPYTGAGPQALMVTRNKAMTKKILAHHRLCVPRFMVVRRGEAAPRNKADLFFPAIVKPLRLDASVGISQASVVFDRDQLVERLAFVHDRVGDDAIAEEFIDGRELYVTVVGNGRQTQVLPPMEMVFSDKMTRPEQRIATKALKWRDDYCEERGITLQFARRLSDTAAANIHHTCLTAYRALWLRDYARIDLRLDQDGQAWVLEANANPYLGRGHEAAEAARKAGLEYAMFVERIAKLALRRHRRERKRAGRRRNS